MKKVFLIHGLGGFPNGGWRPWIMMQLKELDIYACSLAMPNFNHPICEEWVDEIKKVVDINCNDELFLVGHSLGVSAIIRYLESCYDKGNIKGVILVSGPMPENQENLSSFLDSPYDFKQVKSKEILFHVIHGDNDPVVPIAHGEKMAKNLECDLTIIPDGMHLNGSSGHTKLPQLMDVLTKMIN